MALSAASIDGLHWGPSSAGATRSGTSITLDLGGTGDRGTAAGGHLPPSAPGACGSKGRSEASAALAVGSSSPADSRGSRLAVFGVMGSQGGDAADLAAKPDLPSVLTHSATVPRKTGQTTSAVGLAGGESSSNSLADREGDREGSQITSLHGDSLQTNLLL